MVEQVLGRAEVYVRGREELEHVVVLIVVYQVKCLSNLNFDGFFKLESLLSIFMKHSVQVLSHDNDPVLSDSSTMLELNDVLGQSQQEIQVPLIILPIECLGQCIVYKLVFLSVDLIDQLDKQASNQTDQVGSSIGSLED